MDSEGFPRGDIDIPTVVQQRRRLNYLRNDHKEITGKIEKLLHQALAGNTDREVVEEREVAPTAPESSASQSSAAATSQVPPGGEPPSSTSSGGPQRQTPAPRPPRPSFASVDIVSDGSPASDAGMRLNDKIISIGPVSLRTMGKDVHQVVPLCVLHTATTMACGIPNVFCLELLSSTCLPCIVSVLSVRITTCSQLACTTVRKLQWLLFQAYCVSTRTESW